MLAHGDNKTMIASVKTRSQASDLRYLEITTNSPTDVGNV